MNSTCVGSIAGCEEVAFIRPMLLLLFLHERASLAICRMREAMLL